MKKTGLLLLLLPFLSIPFILRADTPGTAKANVHSGDGLSSITATAGTGTEIGLDVHVINSSGSTVTAIVSPLPLPVIQASPVSVFPSPSATFPVLVTNSAPNAQGSPAPAVSAWPVYLPSPIPSQTVTIANPSVSVTNTPVVTISGTPTVSVVAPSPLPVIFSTPVPISGPVSVFPSPTATFPVAIASSIPLTISNFPSPSPTITVSVANVPTVNQGSPAPAASAWPVTIAGPSPLPVVMTSAGNSNSSLSSRQTVMGTESNVVAPTHAVGVIVECESVNADNLRWGSSNSSSNILSSTLGVLCEPGRDSGYVPLGASNYVHLISTGAGSDFADIQWVLSQ